MTNRSFFKWIIMLAGVGVLSFSALLALSTPKPPPLIEAVERVGAQIAGFKSDQPVPSKYLARDGRYLSYYYYLGQSGHGVAVLVHGSTGMALQMHALARALQAQNINVYAIDLRGHGLNLPLGDVQYRGQTGDDLHDLVEVIATKLPQEKRILIGHSLGGSFVLRMAGEKHASDFDGYIALSPFMGANTPMDRPNQGGWTDVAVPRIVGLSILNAFHISFLDHLNVIAYAVPDSQITIRPRYYTHALLNSLTLPQDWRLALKTINAPTRVMIGERDELFIAEAYQREIVVVNPNIAVTTILGVGHMEMVLSPLALREEVTASQKLLAH